MVGPWEFDRSRAAWWVAGLLLGVATVYVVHSFVGTFVFGIFIYYATRPVYNRLKRRVRPPSLAAAVALLALALPALLLMAYTAAIGLQELIQVSQTTTLGELPATVRQYANVSTIAGSPEELLSEPPDPALARDILDEVLQYVGFIGTAALHLFVMIAIAFYLLRDDHKLSRWFRHQFSDENGVVESYVRSVDRDFNNIFFGNILNALLTATIGALSYNALHLMAPGEVGIPYPTLMGLLTGVASLIPVVGMKLVYFPVTGYIAGEVLINSPELAWFPVAFFLVSFVIVDTIPDLVLRPYVSGRSLHVGMVMLAYILGPLLFGWYGIFLGPMLLVLVVNFVRIVLPELLSGVPIQPWAVDPTHIESAQMSPDALENGDDEAATADGERREDDSPDGETVSEPDDSRAGDEKTSEDVPGRGAPE